jgi:hypothetical protein
MSMDLRLIEAKNKKQGSWVNGKLHGQGSIVHADHKIQGVFLDNDNMGMPVDLLFFKTGYTKQINDLTAVGMTAVDPA